jgi:integrase
MAARRSPGEGSLYPEANGGWRGSIDLGYTIEGKRDRRRVRGSTKTEVRQKLKDLQRQVDDGVSGDRTAMTVNQLLDHHLDVVLPARRRSPGTIDNYRWTFGIIRPSLGRRRLRDLTPEHIETLLRKRTDLSRASLDRIRVNLASALTEAQRRDWVQRNVAQLAYTPNSHTTERRAMTASQANDLLDAASGHRLEAAIVIGLLLGLRPGELLGVPWEAIGLDGDPATLSVSQTLKHHKGDLSIGDVKTRHSIRTLGLPELAATALRRHRAAQRQERLRAGPHWRDHGLVFTTEVGTPIDPSNFRRTFDQLTAKANIGHWAPYEMRHTAITLGSEAGIPAELLADLAGHADTRMIVSTYRHPRGPVQVANQIASQLNAGRTA